MDTQAQNIQQLNAILWPLSRLSARDYQTVFVEPGFLPDRQRNEMRRIGFNVQRFGF